MYVLTQATLLAEAILEIAAGGPFHTPKMALYTSDVYPNKTSQLSDFVITDFGGLTNLQAIVWGAPWVNDNGQAEILGALLNWLTTSITGLPVTAYGYVMTDSTGAVLLLAERFAVPLVFGRSGQSEGVLPRLVFDT
jgi:hypothetical protein